MAGGGGGSFGDMHLSINARHWFWKIWRGRESGSGAAGAGACPGHSRCSFVISRISIMSSFSSVVHSFKWCSPHSGTSLLAIVVLMASKVRRPSYDLPVSPVAWVKYLSLRWVIRMCARQHTWGSSLLLNRGDPDGVHQTPLKSVSPS